MKAILFFLLTALFWGLNFHLAKVMLKEVGFVEAGFWRYFFGVIPLLFLTLKSLPTRNEIVENIVGLSLVGIVCLFGFNLFFFLGLKNSPAINGALIVSLTPGLTVIFSGFILKTPFERNHVIGVAISLLGVLYLILKGNIGSFSEIEFNTSDLLFIVSTTFFALQNVFVKKYGGRISNRNFTFLTNLLCMMSFLVLLPFLGIESITGHTSMFWLSAIGIGVFGTAVAYFLWNAGIKLTSANQAGIFINVVPLSTAMFSIIIGETLFAYHLISGIFIIIGILIMRWK